MAFPATLDYLNNMSRIGALSPMPINDLLRVGFLGKCCNRHAS